MKKIALSALILFIAGWLVVGIMWIPGCSYSKMPMREVTWEYRFYNYRVSKGEILCVFLRAKHDQDFSWIKSNDDYDVISWEKTYYRESGGGRFSRPIDYEAIKVYMNPKRSFLLNWTYKTDKDVQNTLYTKIELK